MNQLERRVTALEGLHGPSAPPPIDQILTVSVSRNHETGELIETPHMLRIVGDPCCYMVADYEAWPDDVKARYDGR